MNIKVNYKNFIVFEGDCKDSITKIPSSSVRLIITSPPYNIGKEYECKTDINQYLMWFDKLFCEFYRVLVDGGSICWQVGNFVNKGEIIPLDIVFYPIFKNIGFNLRNRIIWHFGHGLHASKRFSGRYETVSWYTKGDGYVFNLDPIRIPSKYPGKKHFKGSKKGQLSCNPLGKNPSDFWDIKDEWGKEIWEIPNVKCNHPEKTDHPCQFPVELVQRCVLALTNEGDTVLDPFSGSGTTAIASLIHNRKVILCEKESSYLNIMRSRINDLQNGIIKVRPLGEPIFGEK